MTVETGPPRLLHFRVSHFNEKVRWALDHKRWPHVRQAQVPGFHVPRVRWLSGQNQLPVLVIDGRNMGVDPETLAAARKRMPTYFDRLESEIGPNGYLVGVRFGIADLAAAAVMTAIIRPPQFPYPLPEPWPPALVELRSSVAGHPGFRWVLDIYARHRGTSCEIVSQPAAQA